MGFVLKLGVLFSCLPSSATELHTLQYFYTATSGVPVLPPFISVGVVDGVEISCYDSNRKRNVPKQMWMEQLDQEYWDSETELSKMYERIFRVDLNILRRRFNHTEGVHVLQRTYGCQWDDNIGATDGYEHCGYDGEDFLSLDLENMTWIAAVPQALPSKLKWDNTERFVKRDVYFKETCVDWLKKYLHYGSSTLGRKVPPDVSVFQKDSSAVCHATGVYPGGVMITWKGDGVEMQEDVDVGETLPNGDGTFQKRVVLTVSPEERKDGQYTCEVAHESGHVVKTLSEEDGMAHNMVLEMASLPLLSRGASSGNSLGIMISWIVTQFVVMCVLAGLLMMKMKDYKKAEQSDTDSDDSMDGQHGTFKIKKKKKKT